MSMSHAFIRLFSAVIASGVAACTPSTDGPMPASGIPGPNLAARGQLTAERVCGFCHQVVPTRGPEIEAAAPSFMEIANLPGRNRGYLRQFTSEEHLVETLGETPVPMPTTLLTPEEREEVIAYILSFQEDPETGRKPPVRLEPFE